MLREWCARNWSVVRPLFGIGVGLLLAGIIMMASGFHPLAAYSALWSGATGLEAGAAVGPNAIKLGSGHINLFLLAQSLGNVTPLILTGLAISVALRAGMFNVGAQGQMTVGALTAAAVGEIGRNRLTGDGTLPPGLHVMLVLVAGAVAGAVWGALPGLLKAKRGVHEVISTIMLNFVAMDVVLYLVTHSLKDDSPGNQAAQSSLMATSSWLYPYIQGSNLTAGLPIALILTLLITLFIHRTSPGYQIRAVGQGLEAARANGVQVSRVLIGTLALSGAIAGVAGAVEVMGIHHRYVGGVAGSAGFDGIAVALLGNLSGVGVLLSAIFFGALSSGSLYMQTNTNVPAPISEIVQATVIILAGMKIALTSKMKPVNLLEPEREKELPDGVL